MSTANINNLPATLRELALEVAISQLGVQEAAGHHNSGLIVEEYLKSVGLGAGYAWCQAFVYWVFMQSAARMGVKCPVIKTAGVYDCWNKTAAINKITKADALHKPTLIEPGFQFILEYGGGKGHTGIVERIDHNDIYTIEGNSNNDGSRDGYEVVSHKRNLNDKALVGFIAYP